MIDLQKFCAQESGRYMIGSPFECGDGWRGATDGRFAIRVPSDCTIRNEMTPKLSQVFYSKEIMGSPHIPIDDSLFVPMTKDSPDARIMGIKCRYCKGSGCESKRCDKCEGECVEECPTCYHESDCDRCDGNGVIPIEPRGKCPYCANGTRFDVIRWGNSRFDGSKVKYMCVHAPGLEVIPASFGKAKPVAFWHPEGQALLMSLTEE